MQADSSHRLVPAERELKESVRVFQKFNVATCGHVRMGTGSSGQTALTACFDQTGIEPLDLKRGVGVILTPCVQFVFRTAPRVPHLPYEPDQPFPPL
jgi:hypothetical protein